MTPFYSRYLIIFLLLCPAWAYGQLDSLKQALRPKEGKARIELLQEIAFQFLFVSPDSAFPYAEESLLLSQKNGYDSLLAEANMIRGFAYFVAGDNEEALAGYQKAADLHHERGDIQREASALSNLAATYNQIGRLEKALEVTLLALDRLSEGDNPERYGLVLGNAGMLFLQLRQVEEAKKYVKKGKLVLTEVGSTRFLGNITNMLGSLLSDQDSLEAAKQQFFEAMRLYQIEDDPLNRSSLYNNLGYYYKAVENLDSAMYFYQKAFDLSVELNNSAKKLKNASSIAEVLLYSGQLELAGIWLDIARDQTHLTTERPPLSDYYQILSTYQGLKGNFYESFRSAKLSGKYRDSLMTEERERAVAELQIKFETEKNERELAEANLQLQRQKQERERLILGGLILLALIVLGIVLWVYKSGLEKREAIHQERLRQQEIRLEATIETQEEERSRLARDLHDGIGQLLSATRLNFGTIEGEVENQNFHKALNMLDEACREVREVAHAIMPRSLESEGLPAAIQEILEKSLGNTPISFHFEIVGLLERLNKKLEINIYRIVQELIQNILKHSSATEVNLQLIRRPDKLLLIIEDNGTGLDQAPKPDGIGMINIQTRTNAINGYFNIENGPDTGTIATLRIPLI